MGIYECQICGEEMCGISYGCEVCGYAQGDGNILCDNCATKGGCDNCGEYCCVICASEDHKYPCCGMVICGSGKKDDYESKEAMRKEYGVERDACIWDHVTKDLDCGHKGCNFYKEGCYSCNMIKKTKEEGKKITKDMALAEDMLEKASSDELKDCLRGFLSDPRSKKRKRDEDKLEKYRNAVNRCKCDARYFAY